MEPAVRELLISFRPATRAVCGAVHLRIQRIHNFNECSRFEIINISLTEINSIIHLSSAKNGDTHDVPCTGLTSAKPEKISHFYELSMHMLQPLQYPLSPSLRFHSYHSLASGRKVFNISLPMLVQQYIQNKLEVKLIIINNYIERSKGEPTI